MRIRRMRELFAWALLILFVATPSRIGIQTSHALVEGDFYRPLPPTGSGVVGTSAAYRRSPCPAINTLANHGYIARDGKEITAVALKRAIMTHFNIDDRYADTLVALAKKPVFNLDELSLHNNVEHDMSLVHKDAFYGHDPALTDPPLVDDLFGHVGASGLMDPWFFARTQQRRLRDCMTNNPQCEFSNEFLLSVTLGRQGLLMRSMGATNQEAVNATVAKTFLVDETFPKNWEKPAMPISQDDIHATRVRLFALLKASGEWLGDGFGTTSQPLVSDAGDASLCLQPTKEVLTVSGCTSESHQLFQLDATQRLVVGTAAATGRCLVVADGSKAPGAQIVATQCAETTQKWRYDASGRLRPVHAADLCVDLVKPGSTSTTSGLAVLTAVCSSRPEQRFFSYYANFQPSGSHLTSIYAQSMCLGLDQDAASRATMARECDSFDETQRFTLDGSKRLVFQYDPAQCVDVDDTNTVVQKPCSSETATWKYDSLGRLHPSTDPSKCLLYPTTTSSKQVTLQKCSDTAHQKWFASDTNNADIRPQDQYYRPNVFESSGKPGTKASYSRSPCPALNTLANHGLLPRSGRNLTADQVKQAVVNHFNIDPAYAQVLVGLAKKNVFDLDELSIHNAAEHDMSLVHADAFYGQDPAVTDPTLTADLWSHVSVKGQLDTLYFARTQARRLRDCQARNPQCDFSNEFLMGVALGRLGLLMRAVGGNNKDLVDVATAKSFLVDEKFPMGFLKSSTPITQANIQETRKHIFSLLKSSNDWLASGFAGAGKSTNVVSEGSGSHTLCLTVANGSIEPNEKVVFAPCDPKEKHHKMVMDDQRRLVMGHSQLCLAALDFGVTTGTEVVQVECSEDASNQRWSYDGSGRLHPAHASRLCMGFAMSDQIKSGSQVVLDECSGSQQQRFYTVYDAFQPNASHLTSIKAPELCLGVINGSLANQALVQVSPCDPDLADQQITLDATKRLVFKHSGKCLSVASTAATEESASVVQATCLSDTTQLWQYDSLGRLHPVSDPSHCLTIDGAGGPSAEGVVVLADCDDSSVQKWYSSDAKDPNNRPQNAYYRPNRDESSGKFATGAIYSRSPCPALNALANHGILSRDGRNISRMDLMGAAIATFNIELAIAEALLDGFTTDEYINLDDFSDPKAFSYVGSLLHSDGFFTPDAATIDPDLVSDLFGHVGADNTIDLVYLAAAYKCRLEAAAANIEVEGSNNSTMSQLKYLKPGLVLRVLSGTGALVLDAETAKSVLVEERIPDGFVKPSAAVTESDAMASAETTKALLESGARSGHGDTWLSKPFQPTKAQIFALQDSGVVCMDVANRVVTLEQCDDTKPSQLFTYDGHRNLVVEASETCVDVLDGKLGNGASLGHVGCTDWPHQKWVFDASGRLHPQHGPKFCLDITMGSNGVVNKCSDREEQVFFAAFRELALHNQQLVSAAGVGKATQLTRCLSAASSAALVGTDQCDATKQQKQSFSLDDQQRLVILQANSDDDDDGDTKCVTTTDKPTLGSTLTLASCAGDAYGGGDPATPVVKWMYDSLGRLHVTGAMELCLATSETATETEPVTLEMCSVTPSQKWIVATLTAQAPGSSGRPGEGESSSSSAGFAMVPLWIVVLATAHLAE